MTIITDKNKIEEVLSRGVEEVLMKEHLKKRLLTGEQLRIKLGIDPTGPKIHIGRAIVLWKLRAFQDLGHKIVLIIGDFTAQIGDASDKESMRKCLTEKEIKDNMKTYQNQMGKILDLEKAEFRRNSEWLLKLKMKDIIQLAMKFSAQQLINRRNFKERWEKENTIGRHELLYPIMQGYDSVAVQADVEIGGLDQLFNLKVGRDLQRFFEQEPQDIMTLKMLYGLDGRKMSTIWGNVINITDPPDEMYGKIMSINDELIGDYFELCTRLPMVEVEKIKKQLKSRQLNPRDVKAQLASEIVKLYYGEREAQKAEAEFNKIFRERGLPSEIPVFKTAKKVYLILDLLKDGGLATSKSEAKRLVLGGAVEIDDKVKTDWREEVKLEDGIIIKVGKRKFLKIILI